MLTVSAQLGQFKTKLLRLKIETENEFYLFKIL